jgi:DNA-binding phage protein
MNVQEYVKEDGANPYQTWLDSLNSMAAQKTRLIITLTRDSSITVIDRIGPDSEFAVGLLDEVVSLFLNGEPDVARLVLRDLVNGTIGFEGLTIATSKSSKSLHRMLSIKGNPTMDNLTLILGVLRRELQVEIQVQAVACV